MKNHIAFHFSKVLLTTCYYLLVVFPIIVSAADVTLQWDANDPAPDGYRLYARQSGEAFDYSKPLWEGSVAMHQVQDLTPGVTYFFVVRAFVGDAESSDSNQVEYYAVVSGTLALLDSDEDGFADTVDAFPDDPSEWLDTDNDGVGNNADTDDDGDGMPDNWEIQYIGLNPLVNDAYDDLDGDGIFNLDEYHANSDPSDLPGNTPPDQPVLVAPYHDAVVDLSPTFNTGTFVDADGDAHGRTQYQIATQNDFASESLVYDHTSMTRLTSLKMVDLILDPETGYYWRVRFFDEQNGVSEWSETLFFTTMGYNETGDADADGVIDDQQADATVDMDGNGTADVIQEGILSVNTPCEINPLIAVKRNADDVQLVAIKAYSADGLGLAANQPEQMTGVLSFKLYLDPDVTQTSVTIFFYEAAPADAQWYKYDPEEGWSAYSHASFSADRKSVTIALEDGGIGDQDGVRNGVIVDPAGLGFSGSSDDSTYSSATVGAGAGGCFIGSTANEAAVDIVISNFYKVLIFSMSLSLLLIACRYVQMKRP